jgi:hypothetical protein
LVSVVGLLLLSFLSEELIANASLQPR